METQMSSGIERLAIYTSKTEEFLEKKTLNFRGKTNLDAYGFVTKNGQLSHFIFIMI